MDTGQVKPKEIEWLGLINKIIGKHMKQFKLVDSLNTKKMVRHIEACNWYIREFVKKHGLNRKLDKRLEKSNNGIEVKTIITKQEIWVKE